MRKWPAIAGSLLFLAVPGSVAGLVPWWLCGWRVSDHFSDYLAMQLPLRAAGALLIALGVLGLLDSFRRFAVQGLGTPAPVLPTRHLVVGGLYRYVRNPMYVAVIAAIVGQALLFGKLPLLVYGGLVWLACHGFVCLYEEPVLRAGFGGEYREFCAAVPRWMPRTTPWRGPAQS